MQYIILAAGRGKRLKKKTLNIPKFLVKIKNKSILEYQLKLLEKFKFNRKIILTGYKHEKIEEKKIQAILIKNKDYLKTNMLYTLFLSKKFLIEEDSIIAYGDIVFEEKILRNLINSPKEFVVVIDKDWKRLWNLRHGKIIKDFESLEIKKNKIVDIGRRIKNLKKIQGQYIGLIKIKKKTMKLVLDYYNKLRKMKSFENENIEKMYFTTFIRYLISKNIEISPLTIKSGWLELDTIKDLNNYNKNKKISTYCNLIR